MNWKKKFALISTFTGAVACTTATINRIVSFNASKENILYRSSGFYYSWKFGKIFYKKIGIGKPLLLIHDLQAFSSHEEWEEVINELAKKHTVYAIDLLGCGRSEKPNILYTNYLYVQLLNDFIKQVIGSKTDVISMGESSSFVLATSHNNPELINKIIMVSPKSIDDLSQIPDRRSKTSSWLINLPLVGTFLYHILMRKKCIGNYFNKEYFFKSDSYTKAMLNKSFEAAHTDSSKAKHLHSSIIGQYTTVQLNGFLKKLNNSIYIISGDKFFENRAIQKEYQESLPSIEGVIIDNCGNLPQMNQPVEFIEHTELFLS